MAVSYIGNATGVNTATLPAHQAGDLLIAFAFRDGSNSTPGVPAGWTTLESNTTNSAGAVLAYKVAASGSEVSGTWSNATSLVIHVYRGAHASTPVGDSAGATGSSTTVSYPALTLTVGGGSSWVAGFGAHRSTNTSLETPPTGMTNRTTLVDGTDEVAGHDTNGGVTSWSNQNVSVGGTSSGWFGATVEIIAAGGGTETANVSAVPVSFSVPSVTATYVGPPPAVPIVFLVPAVTAVGLGIDIYVATTGNDTTGDGTIGNPYLTVQKGFDVAMPGDTIIVRTGTYPQNVHTVRAGSSGAPITLRPYTGETVTLQFTESGAGTGIYGVYINHDYIHIRQFDGTLILDDGHDTINVQDADNCFFEDFEILDSFTEGIRLRGTSSNNIMDGLLIHNTGNGGGNGEGIYIGTGGGTDNCNFNEVRNCEIHTATDGGIDIKENCHDNIIEDNEVYNTTGGGSGQIDDRGFDNVIRRNNVHDSITGAGIYPGDGTAVYRNRSYGNAGNGIKISESASPLIYNNTLYGNGDSGIETTSTAGTAIDIRNNIVFDNTNAEIHEAAAGQFATFNYNYVRKTGGGTLFRAGNGSTYTTNAAYNAATGFNANGSDADPELTDPANDDFTSQADSPVRDAGVAISPYTDGYLGSAPDIGWDEQALTHVAGVAPVAALLTVTAVTAAFVATAAVSPLSTALALPAITPTYTYVVTASVLPVAITFTKRINLIPNPSFENNITDNWSEYTSSGAITSERVTDESAIGSASYKISAVTPSDAGLSHNIVLKPGKYYFAGYVKTGAGVENAHLIIRENTGFNTLVSYNVTANEDWQRLSGTFTLTSEQSCDVLIGLGSYGAASDGEAWFDGLYLVKEESLGDYFDGSMNGSQWKGAAHNSPSLQSTLTDVTATGFSVASVVSVAASFIVSAVTVAAGFTASVPRAATNLTIPAVAATYQSTVVAAPVPVNLVIPAVTARYVATAAAQAVAAQFTLPAVTAVGTRIETAAITAVRAGLGVPSVAASHHSKADVAAVRIAFTVKAVAGQSNEFGVADVDPIAVALAMFVVAATHRSTAVLTPVGVHLAAPVVSPFNQQVASPEAVGIIFAVISPRIVNPAHADIIEIRTIDDAVVIRVSQEAVAVRSIEDAVIVRTVEDGVVVRG